jgi:DNA polymerase-4
LVAAFGPDLSPYFVDISLMFRKIIHIDMDAFYASVEQRDFPEYRGKPIAVGGLSDRGVLATASYEARKFGVKSAMPTWMARQKCPQLIIVHPRFEAYKQVSEEIREIFKEYTDLIEPLSLDEAYLDVTENHKNIPIATEVAQEIKTKILEKTGLTASAGVSFNKFLAKIASDMYKPSGLYVITPKKAPLIIDRLPIERFHGVGKVTADKMKKFGINTGADLKLQTLEWLTRHFGKTGKYYYKVAHGEDNRPVDASQIRKSISVENTFESDLSALEEMETEVVKLIEKLWKWVDKRKITGRTITLKMKFNDFSIITRSKSGASFVNSFQVLNDVSLELLHQSFDENKPVRLLGLGLSNLNNTASAVKSQLEIDFENGETNTHPF